MIASDHSFPDDGDCELEYGERHDPLFGAGVMVAVVLVIIALGIALS